MPHKQEFIKKVKDGAIRGWEKHKILPSLTIAQACLESSFGQSKLATEGNNLFGIKGDYKGESIIINTREQKNDGSWITIDAEFAKYPDQATSVEEHGAFFSSTPWRKENYKHVFGETDYKEAVRAILPPEAEAGYATDKMYADKIINIIEQYNLTQYDKGDNKMSKPTVLFIAGHGRKRNGVFDPGATGMVKEGEHRYMTNKLFPAIRKHLPAGAKAQFLTSHNVYDYGDLVTQARKYGRDTIVIECHFDAVGNNVAKGGHVIIHKGYKPDSVDLALVKAIKDSVGIFTGYKHRGHAGLSGRNNLANVNRAARGGVNYRLIELGFCTNPADASYMNNRYEDIAKSIVKNVFGSTGNKAVASASNRKPVPKYTSPSIPFTKLKSGDKVKIRAVKSQDGRDEMPNWYIPAENKWVAPSKSFLGQTITIDKVINVSASYSKRAYLIKEANSYLLEQDIEEARAGWKVVKKEEPATKEPKKDNQFVIDNVLYEVNEVK